MMPAVKANAYGHGAIAVATTLQELGVTDFCVSAISEAIELRKAGITGQILILGYTSPRLFDQLVEQDLTQTIVDLPYAKELNKFGKKVKVHVGIDTGLHRLGVRSEEIEQIIEVWKLSHLQVTGVYSHLSVADDSDRNSVIVTRAQIEAFNEVVGYLKAQGLTGFKTHLQGSYGILNYPELKYDFVRPGIALYGVLSRKDDHTVAKIDLRPVLSMKARIECVKRLHQGEAAGYGLEYRAAGEQTIAAVSIGYADGVPRELSNRGHVLIQGKTVPIIGKICMDQLLVDISSVKKVMPGEEVVFIGNSDASSIQATEFAATANTISNEVLSRLGTRLERLVV